MPVAGNQQKNARKQQRKQACREDFFAHTFPPENLQYTLLYHKRGLSCYGNGKKFTYKNMEKGEGVFYRSPKREHRAAQLYQASPGKGSCRGKAVTEGLSYYHFE